MPVRQLHDWLNEHPRISLALKSAIATSLAWLVVQSFGDLAHQHPYYAPLGALLAVDSTVASSVRGSIQGLLAILIGAALALGLGLLGWSEVASVGLVVVLGTLVGGWWRLGGKSSWVPLTGVFVLIIGGHNQIGYASDYLLLTALGAVVGLLVNAAFPSLPLTPAQATVTRLRRSLADQLDDLAEGLLQETPPDLEGWQHRRRDIRSLTGKMHEMVAQAMEARRGNWRSHRWQRLADEQYQQARSLEQLAFLVEEMASFVTWHERAEQDRVALGPELRPYVAHAFQEMAETLRSIDGEQVDLDRLSDADASLCRLVEEVHTVREKTDSDLFGAGTVIMTLRRAVTALAPSDFEQEIRSY